MPQNLLIIGATGLIGKYITKEIIEAKGSVERIVILTSKDTTHNKASEINDLKQSGIEVLVGDITKEEDVKNAYHDIDTVISCVGRNVIAQQIPLIQWASETSVTRFFPSEYGTDIEYSLESASEKPHQQKLKVRRYMSTVTNLECTYLVTGPYSDLYFAEPPFGRFEAGGFNVKEKKCSLLGDGKGRISFTAMADVGRLLVAALQHPAASRNRVLIVNSFTTSPDDILAEFEKQTGTKWEVQYTGLEKLKEIEERAWRNQDPLATALTLRRIWAEGGTLYEKRDNELIGDPPMETMTDQVRQAIERS
ncbi:hypothetical protein EPUS_00763 [Endocarpon pusillum Z07020]|uniref:NmrA-like domain-containing protein n=1 Tax=Endocarpon pusillum (strain Z07020 / HMAS-L-300199) TaxID=1263415 RepID=U1GQN8_ENDPU|nr:uncharacterized protein EPUS_00763 [Endocarpon pusillum Z07020]ERF74633.1 hypothetical protein EPUS_00763 [Endocarpon pusillum Z07020]